MLFENIINDIVMELNDFVKNFVDQFDDTDESGFSIDAKFRELDEWSSLVGLAEMNMIAKKYGVKVTPAEMRQANTIQELFELVLSKL